MQEQPPIELNYAGEPAKEKDASLDSRLLRVKLPENYKPKPDTLKLDLGPGNTKGMPLRVRPGTEIYKANEVIFRAELDLPVIEQQWGSVEAAAKKSHSILITVETDPPKGRPKQTAKCRTVVTINLHAIRWRWKTLTKDASGRILEGHEQKNVPVEITIDEKGTYGFEITLESEKRQRDGTYKPSSADFTHYLSPDGQIDKNILQSVPLAWAKDADPRRITTRWWTQPLAKDHEIFGKLPVNTMLRVHAYPGETIRQHFPEKRPLTKPPNLEPLALREIPLTLRKGKWIVALKEPDLKLLPFDFAEEAQLKEGMSVVGEVFHLDDKGVKRFMPAGRKLNWRQRYGGAEHPPGKVIVDGKENAVEGDIVVGQNGEIKFLYLPHEENLFLTPKPGTYYAAFDLYDLAPDESRGRKICHQDTPDDEAARSFDLDWAPYAEVEGFKLPFHYESSTATGEAANAVPDETKVKGFKIKIENRSTYRALFRHGGRFVVEPFFPHPVPSMRQNPAAGTVAPESFGIWHCRWFFRKTVVQSDTTARTAEMMTCEGESPASAQGPATVAASTKARYVIEIPTNHKKSEESHELLNHTKMPLRQEVLDALEQIAKKGATASSALALLNKDATGAGSVDESLSRYFVNGSLYFGGAPSEELGTNRESILHTFAAVAVYLEATAKTCPEMVRAFELHAMTFTRFKDNLINAFFDVISLEKMALAVKKMFGAAWSARGAVFQQLGSSGWTDPLIKPETIGNWARKNFAKATETGGDFLAWTRNQLAKGSLWLVAKRPMERTAAVFKDAIADASKEVAEHAPVAAQTLQTFTSHRNELDAAAKSIRNSAREAVTLKEKLLSLQSQAAQEGTKNLGRIERMIDETSSQLSAKLQTINGQIEQGAKLHDGMLEALGKHVDSECMKRAGDFRKTVFEEAHTMLKQQMELVDFTMGMEKIDDKHLARLEKACKDFSSMKLDQKQIAARLNTVSESLLNSRLNPGRNRAKQVHDAFLQEIRDASQSLSGLEGLETINQPSLQRVFNLRNRVRETVERNGTSAGNALNSAFSSYDSMSQTHIQRAANLVQGTVASVVEIYKDGCKSGSISHHQAISGFVEASRDPANAQPATPGDGGWFDTLASVCQQLSAAIGTLLSWLADLPSALERNLAYYAPDADANAIIRTLYYGFGGLVTTVLGVTRAVLGGLCNVIGWLLQKSCWLIYEVLGKLADFLIYLFTQPDLILNFPHLTRLQDAAFKRGETVLGELKLREEVLFGFKFDQELYLVRELQKKAAAGQVVTDFTAAATDMKRLAGTGFDHYYPGLKAAGWRTYSGLCAAALNVELLKRDSATADDQQFVRYGQSAEVALRGDIDSYWDAYEDVKADSEQFGTSFLTAFHKVEFRQCLHPANWNWKLIDTIIDWLGWGFAWGCRALVLFAALVCGLPVPAAASIIAKTDISDFVAGFLKVLVTAMGTYPKVLSFPLDLIRAHALAYDMAFGIPASRFKATSSTDIVFLGPKA